MPASVFHDLIATLDIPFKCARETADPHRLSGGAVVELLTNLLRDLLYGFEISFRGDGEPYISIATTEHTMREDVKDDSFFGLSKSPDS